MNTDLPSASACYGVYDKNNIIAFMAVLHQPHRKKNLKRCSRLVVLPDYQGIGIGTKFLNVIAEYYTKNGFAFHLVTSAKNMIHALNNSNHWMLLRYNALSGIHSKSKIDNQRKSIRTNCKTASFVYR